MSRGLVVVVLLFFVGGCGRGVVGVPAPVAEALAFDVVSFDRDGGAAGGFAAVSGDGFDYRAFAGWFGGDDGDEHEVLPAREGTTYVAVTAATGCRAPESVGVGLVRDDLVVTFDGGTDHEECVRAVGPSAVVALRTSQVRGVRTVNGQVPVDPAGPGALATFVGLGTGGFGAIAPAELGATDVMAARLGGNADALAALAEPVPASQRGFAFVLTGCAETGAVLLVSHDAIDADLTGGEKIACDAPAYFLTTFHIADEDLPPTAVLTN